MGFFRHSGKIKSTLNPTTNYGEGSYREYGFPYQVAEGATVGSLPADSEQFMMIEDLYKTTEKLNKHIDAMSLNKVNIEFLRKQMDKVLEDIEELKDANREIHYKNGSKTQ